MHSIHNFDINNLGKMGDFTGIGSRNINREKSLFMFKIGFCMALSGYRLKSGAADGSDTSFEYGYRCAISLLSKYLDLPKDINQRMMQLFLAWPNFNGRTVEDGGICSLSDSAKKIASDHHSGWHYLGDAEQKLMTRNVLQILGIELSEKSNFTVCHTDDGAYTSEMTSSKTGGTGQAIRIASSFNVPVFNLSQKKHHERLANWVQKTESDFMSKFGINIKSYSEDWYNNYIGIENAVEGDLISLAKQGKIDVLIHGCNIHNVEGAGFCKSLFDAFPEAREADHKTQKGDKRKLGTYSSADCMINGKKLTIINAYTQENYGRDPEEVYVSYKAVKSVFNQISKDFKGRQLSFPKIGAGLASGCWITLSNIINYETRYMRNPMLCVLPGELEMELDRTFYSMKNYTLKLKHDDNFVFFFSKDDPFSNWHYSKFFEGNIMFESMEQYMMYHKAMLMGDKEKAKEILCIHKGDPREAKRLGKEVCNDSPNLTWDENLWIENRESIVIKGAILKYTQNIHLLQPLLATGNRVMVEASPYDGIWGVKMNMNNKNITSPDKWNGLNLLGKVTGTVRSHIVSSPDILCEKGRDLLNEAIQLGLFNDEPNYSEQLSLI